MKKKKDIDEKAQLKRDIKEAKKIFKQWQEITSDLGRSLFLIEQIPDEYGKAEKVITKSLGIDKNCIDFFRGKFFEYHKMIPKTRFYLFYPFYNKSKKVKFTEENMERALRK